MLVWLGFGAGILIVEHQHEATTDLAKGMAAGYAGLARPATKLRGGYEKVSLEPISLPHFLYSAHCSLPLFHPLCTLMYPFR